MENKKSIKSGHYYYKTAAIRVLGTSTKTFDRLGIEPDHTEDNPHKRNGKAYCYTRRQVMDAAIRLGRTAVYDQLMAEEALSRAAIEMTASCPAPASKPGPKEEDASLWEELF